ncbi:MAG: hypothetical protein AAF810_26600, partial [Cyanobacteria bacterium P01_D01_bin.36]
MNSDYIDINNQKRRSPAWRVAFIIDELLVVADYLNVARRAEEGDDLGAGTDRGSARLLLDCRQRLVALHDALYFIHSHLEHSSTDSSFMTLDNDAGQSGQSAEQRRLA